MFILTIRPGLRYLEGVALFVEQADDGFIAAVDAMGLGKKSVKGPRRPEGAVGALWVLDDFEQLRTDLGGDLLRRARPLADDQTVDAPLVERLDPFAQRALADQ